MKNQKRGWGLFGGVEGGVVLEDEEESGGMMANETLGHKQASNKRANGTAVRSASRSGDRIRGTGGNGGNARA